MQLTGETVIQSIAERIREWIPEVDIRRWSPAGGQKFESRQLGIYTDRDAFDPNIDSVFPFIFIESLGITSRTRSRFGRSERYSYNFTFALAYYVDRIPTDTERVPRINEELRAMELKLMRVLDYVHIFGCPRQVEISPPPTMSDGVLHFFCQVEVSEYTLIDPVPKVEKLRNKIEVT